MEHNMSKKGILVIGLAALLMTLAGCSKKEKAAPAIKRVLTETVVNKAGAKTATYPGRTKASDEANVAFRVSGTLLKVSVHKGDRVRRGQVIAQIDDRDYRTQLAATEAEYTQIKAEAERVMALYADSVGTANNYDKARYGLQQITQKRQLHRDQLADCVLRAPFDGYVQKVLKDSHETVGAGMPIVKIIADGQTEIVINIPASEYLRRGQFGTFSAHFEVLPDERFPLQLLSIAHQANVNQLYEVRLGIQGHHPQITPGMSAMVQLTLQSEGTQPVAVPLSAVKREKEVTSVFVYKDGHVRSTQVELGSPHNDGTVDVISGLEMGDQIVVSGVNTLSDGEAVELTPKTSKTNVGGLL